MDALRFYDVETSTAVTSLNIGTVAPASSDDTPLRVRNLSTYYQAEDITVAVDSADDGDQLLLSTDGDTFASSIDVGDIGPGGISATFWLRRVTPSTVPDGPCTAALTAMPTGWSDPASIAASDNVPLTTED